MSDPTGAAGSVVTLDDLEQLSASDAAKGSEALEAKLEGDTIPEELRGKTVKDVLKMYSGVAAALKTSETARGDVNTRLAQIEGRLATPTAREPALPEAQPDYTDDQFKTDYEKDPAAAMLKLQERSDKRMAENLSKRVVPLVEGSAQSAEAQARAQFAEDFTLFGDQIDNFVREQLRGNKPTTPQGWENIISFVRGQKANVEKLFEHRTGKAAEDARKKAQERAEAATGFDGTPSSKRTPPPDPGGAGGELDDVEREVVKGLVASGVVKDEAEYKRWKGVR